jgi:RimJ/RimL family protein N-acetyltransferase
LTARRQLVHRFARSIARREQVPIVPVITTERLRLDAFIDSDIGALADILSEPEVTKNITANGSTAARCRASAAHRINWHNAGWGEHGYGVWAVRARSELATEAGTLLGWCGFAPPDIGDDPEILYGLAPQCWGRGLAQEMARAAIGWLFVKTAHAGASAVIFGRINPVSAAIAAKLGMRKRGTMAMPDFLPDLKLARDVLDYEIWRLGHGRTRDVEALLFQAPYKGGQIASLKLADPGSFEQTFCEAARERQDYASVERAELDRRVCAAFRQGMEEPSLDWYHLDRKDWAATRG